MTLTEIIEKKKILKDQISEFLKKIEEEEREMTEEEKVKYEELVAELENIEKKIGEKENELRSIRISSKTNAEKRYSIISMINNEINKRGFTDFERDIVNEGRDAMNRANLPTSGSIILPLNQRASVQATVTGYGVENIELQKLDLITKLRNKLVLTEAGARFITGLVGNVSVPVYGGSSVSWATENGSATDAAGSFTSVALSPKRLTATLKISKQFLLQENNDAENLLRLDLINSISEKLESTLLGSASGSSTTPAGLGSILGTPTEIASYADIIGLEGSLEAANVYNYSHILSPSLKATLRSMPKATNQAIFVLENGEISGYKALSTASVPTDTGYIGDWSEYIVGQWGALDLTVDPFSGASEGLVRIIVNCYFDGRPRRNSAFAAYTV